MQASRTSWLTSDDADRPQTGKPPGAGGGSAGRPGDSLGWLTSAGGTEAHPVPERTDDHHLGNPAGREPPWNAHRHCARVFRPATDVASGFRCEVWAVGVPPRCGSKQGSSSSIWNQECLLVPIGVGHLAEQPAD
jgi:hypothetical protein